jgi:hypothetical protein
MKALIPIAVFLAVLSPAAILADDGRPVTSKDLLGKTFCWNNGRVASYAANGKFSNNVGGHAQWAVDEPGILQIGEKREQIEVLSDGRLQMHVFNYMARKKPGGVNIYLWATPCSGSKT